ARLGDCPPPCLRRLARSVVRAFFCFWTRIRAMKILLAVDGSKYSIDAVKFLTGHMDWVREKPQVDLVYVHPPVPKLSGRGAVIGKKQLEQYYQEQGAEALAAAKQVLDAAKMPFTAH